MQQWASADTPIIRVLSPPHVKNHNKICALTNTKYLPPPLDTTATTASTNRTGAGTLLTHPYPVYDYPYHISSNGSSSQELGVREQQTTALSFVYFFLLLTLGIILNDVTVNPVSSNTSRLAAFSNVSPTSTNPPIHANIPLSFRRTTRIASTW